MVITMNTLCQITGCPNAILAKGLCNTHYLRQKRHGDPLYTPPSDEERFWKQVLRTSDPDECWFWQGGKNWQGYGRFHVGYRSVPAHRVAFNLTHPSNPLGKKEFCLHICDNPTCCNPKHLTRGDHTINMRDREVRGRTARGTRMGRYNREKTHCPKGHLLEGANLYLSVKGKRGCNTCRREAALAYKARQKGQQLILEHSD